MKYTVNINQKAVCDAGYDLDLTDMAIFDVLTIYTNSTSCKKMTEAAAMYFNVPYKVIIDELPLAKISKPDSVYRRFQKLAQYGIIEMHPENKKMKQVWFAWGRNYLRLHTQTGLKSDQPESNPVKVDEFGVVTGLKSGLRPDENPPHNNTNHYTPNKSVCDTAARAENLHSTLEAEKNTPPPQVPAAPPAPSPSPESVAYTTDPARLEMLLRDYYKARPADWAAVRERLEKAARQRGVQYSKEKIAEVVTRYCDWSITQNHTGWKYSQHHARLLMWVGDQPAKDATTNTAKPAPAVTPAYVRPKNLITA